MAYYIGYSKEEKMKFSIKMHHQTQEKTKSIFSKGDDWSAELKMPIHEILVHSAIEILSGCYLKMRQGRVSTKHRYLQGLDLRDSPISFNTYKKQLLKDPQFIHDLRLFFSPSYKGPRKDQSLLENWSDIKESRFQEFVKLLDKYEM